MANRSPSSLKPSRNGTPKAAGAVLRAPSQPPGGAVLLGFTPDGRAVYLTVKDRSVHLFIVGGTGSGKSTAMKTMMFQDARARRGFALLDPNTDLYVAVLEYLCYLRAIGCQVREVILFNPSDPAWVLPYNPFVSVSGELSTLVDRRVDATLRVWGQATGDETPRLAKWLKCIYTVLIHCKLTMLEAAYLMDQHASRIRAFLLQGLADPFIRAKLEQLSDYKTTDFLAQMESVENRLMRFLCSGVIRRTMGVGTSALDYAAIIEQGKILLVNLGLSEAVSEEQQRLIGTLVISELFEAAMRRPTGSRPYYLYVDEAGQFVTPELGKALDQCRKKGLHITAAVQHLTQIRAEDPKLYKSVKNNARNKLVFAVPDREDATELADDLFPALTEPEVKLVRRHLSHLLQDTRETSTTEAQGTSESRTLTESETTAHGCSTGVAQGVSEQTTKSRQTTESLAQSEGTGQSWNLGQSVTLGVAEQESHGWSDSQTSAYARARGTATSSGRALSSTESQIQPGWPDGAATTSTALTEGRSESSTSSESESWGESTTHGYQETRGSSRSMSNAASRSVGASRSQARSRGQQAGTGESHGTTASQELSSSESVTEGRAQGRSQSAGTSRTAAVTDQPGTRHLPFWEEDPEHWSLAERRWQAAELLMDQPTGSCYAKLASGREVFGLTIRPPRKFYVSRSNLLRFTRHFLEQHCLPRPEAERLISERQQRLVQAVEAYHASKDRQANRQAGQLKSKKRTPGAEDVFDDLLGRE